MDEAITIENNETSITETETRVRFANPEVTLANESVLNINKTHPDVTMEQDPSIELLQSKIKYDANNPHVMTYYINMGLQSAIEFKNKRQATFRMVTCNKSEANCRLKQIECKEQELTVCTQVQEENLSIIANATKQLENDKNRTKTIVDIMNQRASELEKAYNSLNTEKNLLARTPIEQYTFLMHSDYSKVLQHLKENIDRLEMRIQEEKENTDLYKNNFKTEDNSLMEQQKNVEEKIKTFIPSLEVHDRRDNLKSEFTDSSSKYNAILNQIDEIKLDELLSEMNCLKEQYEQTNMKETQSTKDIEIVIDEKHEILNILKEEVSNTENNITGLLNTSKDVQLQISNTRLQAAEVNKSMEVLSDTFSADKLILKNTYSQKCNELHEIREQIKQNSENKNHVNETYTAISLNMQENQDELKTLTLILNDRKQNHEDIISQINILSEKLCKMNCSELEKILQNLSNTYDKVEDKLKLQRDKMKALILEVSEKMLKITQDMKQKIAAMNAQNISDKTELDANRIQLGDQYNYKIKELEVQVAKYNHDILSVKSEQESLSNRIELKKIYFEQMRAQHERVTSKQNTTVQNIPTFDEKESVNDPKPSSILKSPGSKTKNKKVHFHQALEWGSDTTDDATGQNKTSDDLFNALLNDSPPERLVPERD